MEKHSRPLVTELPREKEESRGAKESHKSAHLPMHTDEREARELTALAALLDLPQAPKPAAH